MPHLTLLEKGSGKTHRIEGTDVLAGRDPACGVFLEGDDAKTVSARHARFFVDDGKWVVEDAGSRNGTYIGTRKLEPGTRHVLGVGDIIGLGLTGTQFSVQEAIGRALAATMLEAAPAVPPPALAGGTVPMRRSEAIRAGIHDLGNGEELRVVLRGVQSGTRCTSQGERITLGRALECVVRVEGEAANSVSRVHAEIGLANGKISLRDGGSRHGTFLNGKKIDGATPLKVGDVLMLGPGGPAFTVEEAVLVPIAAPGSPVSSAPREPAAGGTDLRNAPAKPAAPGIVPAPPPAPKSAPAAENDGVFRADLPTPAARPAAKNPPARSAPAPGPATRLARASIGKIGRTALFRDVVNEITTKNTRRLRNVAVGAVIVFGSVIAAVVAVAKQKMDRTEAELALANVSFKQQSAELDAFKAIAAQKAAEARASVDSAMRAAAPAAVLDSLRQALAEADRRSTGLEESLRRARASLDVQLVAADSVRRAAEQDLVRLRQQIASAAATDASSRAALDSLQQSVRAAEERAKAASDQQRAMKGADFPAIWNINHGAVGMVTAFVGKDLYDGSGFVISPAGYMLTNRHVVRPDTATTDSVFVTMSDSKFAFRADVIMVAPAGAPDVALIRIRGYKGHAVGKIDWTSARVTQGEGAALIGFPAGYDNAVDPTTNLVQATMTAGIFAKVSTDRIQFSGLSVKGSSGSPLFNGSGEVVGIHFAGLAQGPGLGSAVPIARVVPLLPEALRLELGISK